VRLAAERELVVDYARRLPADRLVTATSGNLSLRCGELVAVTPSGLPYDRLTADLVPVVDLDGAPVETPAAPSTELPLHLAAYRATTAGAIVHTHSAYATALGTVVDELPAIHYLVALLGGPVPVVPYATPGSAELADLLAAALTARSGALLRNHGAVTVGAGLAEAYTRSLYLEELAALYARARMLGTPALVPEEEVAKVGELLRHYGGTR
jgi:L-fuculose-phosphate aldolase